MQVDDAADVEDDVRTATGQQLALDCIIQKVFEKYSIGIKTTDKIRHAFQTKLWRMGKKYAQLGGTRRKQQIEEWKASSWLFTIDCEEVRKHLLSQKRHLEDELKREVSKRQKVQSEVSQLRKVTKDQKKAIVTLGTGGKKDRGASAKSWGEYSRMQRSRKRKDIIDGVKTVCDGERFTPVSIQLAHESGEMELVDLEKGTFSKLPDEHASKSVELAHFALYVKDKFSLSDAAYREVSQLTPAIPRLCTLKSLASDFNANFDISPAPDGVIGVQQGLAARLLVYSLNLLIV